MPRADSSDIDWLQPPAEHQGLSQYIETIRERIGLVIAAVVVTTAFAVAYVVTAEEVYEAEAQILVTPVADDDGSVSALGLITRTNDPQRAMQTAAALTESHAAAERTVDRLGLDRSPQSLLRDVSVEPVAESNLLTLTAKGATATTAAELANTFARTAIRSRTSALHERIDDELPELERRLDGLEEGPAADQLAAQIARLEALRAGDDPNLDLTEEATPPGSPSSPRMTASIAAGILAGLLLGIGAAFALRVLDPRLRREAQLRERYRLPVLARVPRERGRRSGPLTRPRLSVASVEAYRTLRSILARPLAQSEEAASVLVTSAGPSEGKTTTAINLASSLALTGKQVILIEADLRRPSIADAVGIAVDQGIVSVLIEESTVEESMVSAPQGDGNLWLLAAEQAGPWGSELLALPAGQELVASARRLADYVVIDSPPLATVVDALPLAKAVDDVVLVARLGVSRLSRLHELAELLGEAGIKPTGFALVGAPSTREPYYREQRRRLTVSSPDMRVATRSD